MPGILDFFKKLDIFPVPINFRIDKQGYFQSWPGFCATIAMAILGIVFSLYLGSDMIEKQNPNIIQKIKSIDTPKEFFFDPEEMPIVVTINGFGFDPSLYTFSAYQYDCSIKGNNTDMQTCSVKPLKMTQCNVSRHAIKSPKKDYYHKLMKSGYYYCLDEKAYMGGLEDTYYMKYIRGIFTTCINSTANNNSCRSREYIKKAFTLFYLTLYWPDYDIDFEDYNYAYSQSVHQAIGPLGMGTSRICLFKFSEIRLDTNKG